MIEFEFFLRPDALTKMLEGTPTIEKQANSSCPPIPKLPRRPDRSNLRSFVATAQTDDAGSGRDKTINWMIAAILKKLTAKWLNSTGNL